MTCHVPRATCHTPRLTLLLLLLGRRLRCNVLARAASVVTIVGRLLWITKANGVAAHLLLLLALEALAVVIAVGFGERWFRAIVGTGCATMSALIVLMMMIVGSSAHALRSVLGESVLATEETGQATAESSSYATWGTAELEVGKETGQNDGSQAEYFLETSNAQDEGQEEQQLQLEDLQYQQQWNNHLLELLASWGIAGGT